MTDYKKLTAFVEAATSNPAHPIYAFGMFRSPALQHYAINVQTLKVIESEQWFKDYPQYTDQLERVMALCESEAKAAAEVVAGGEDLNAKLQTEVDALKARLEALEKKPETPAGE